MNIQPINQITTSKNPNLKRKDTSFTSINVSSSLSNHNKITHMVINSITLALKKCGVIPKTDLSKNASTLINDFMPQIQKLQKLFSDDEIAHIDIVLEDPAHVWAYIKPGDNYSKYVQNEDSLKFVGDGGVVAMGKNNNEFFNNVKKAVTEVKKTVFDAEDTKNFNWHFRKHKGLKNLFKEPENNIKLRKALSDLEDMTTEQFDSTLNVYIEPILNKTSNKQQPNIRIHCIDKNQKIENTADVFIDERWNSNTMLVNLWGKGIITATESKGILSTVKTSEL